MTPRVKPKLKITALDAVVLLLLAAAAAYLIYRVRTHLDYKWDWGVIPQYLLRYDRESGAFVPNLLLNGLFTTIRLSIWATILATIIGTAMGLLRVSRGLFGRMIGRTYVEGIRNLPPLVLVFIFFYFVSDQIFPVLGISDFIRVRSETSSRIIAFLFAPPEKFTAFMSAVITLAVYEGAYITEIIRAGILSVEKGQWEASYALGLSWRQQMRHVILPQAAKAALPPLAGQFISTIKDSAIVSVISVQELTFQGMEMMAATYLTIEIWITITVMYLILTVTCSAAARRLELRLRRSEA